METKPQDQREEHSQDQNQDPKENPVLKVEHLLLGVFGENDFHYHWH